MEGLPEVWNLFGEDHLPYRMLILSRMIDRETQRDLQEKFGLSLAEWRLLAMSHALGPCSAAQIGTAGQIDRAEISRALGKLEAAGLLERSPDPDHGKRQILSVTRKGEQVHTRVAEERRTYFRTITADLSDDERELIETAMTAMAQRIVDGNGD